MSWNSIVCVEAWRRNFVLLVKVASFDALGFVVWVVRLWLGNLLIELDMALKRGLLFRVGVLRFVVGFGDESFKPMEVAVQTTLRVSKEPG